MAFNTASGVRDGSAPRRTRFPIGPDRDTGKSVGALYGGENTKAQTRGPERGPGAKPRASDLDLFTAKLLRTFGSPGRIRTSDQPVNSGSGNRIASARSGA